MKPLETIFGNYTQAELDAQYNNRVRFSDFEESFQLWARMSEKTRDKLSASSQIDVPYGSSPMEKLDIFPAIKRDAPIYVFIHGGYWYSLDKSDYSYVAEGMLPHDFTTIVINFDLAPNVSMTEIVNQNRRAFNWIYQNAKEFGGDPEQIYASGHSAGGHLVAMVMATDWQDITKSDKKLLKGGCAISGLFDLLPIQRSYLNKTLKMTGQEAKQNSPLHLNYDYSAPLLLISGEYESEEYRRQTHEMYNCWEELGYQSEILVGKKLNHFNIVDNLIDPDSQFVIEQLRHFGC